MRTLVHSRAKTSSHCWDCDDLTSREIPGDRRGKLVEERTQEKSRHLLFRSLISPVNELLRGHVIE